MSFSLDLLEQADHLASREIKRPKQASLRRSISTAYYALFHHLTWEATQLIAPYVDDPLRQKMQRWFDHGSMYQACGVFSSARFNGSFEKLLGTTPLSDLQIVARAFRELQQARHSADYDMSSHWTRFDAKKHVQICRDAFTAWKRIRKTSQATVFAHTLLDLKQVQTERS